MNGSRRMLALLMATAASIPAARAATPDDGADIIVTATRRASKASDVPVALTVVSPDQLRQSGASDLRQLNQLVPSLLVSSSSSEASGGGARVRGIGTVGDNAGLESSVATFVDGVYRSRSGVALTELGPVEQVEVLRGPQGTLFGRNASAGLISITTAQPRFAPGGYAEAGYGNYHGRRLAAGVTGPVSPTLALRIDGVETARDGFVKDVVSGRRINDRDRWLVRGKLLWRPDADLSVALSADYARRNEECCVGPQLPPADLSSSTPGRGGGQVVTAPSSIAAILRAIPSAVPGAGKGIVLSDPYDRRVALTPGRSFRQDVRDGGVSAQIDARLGAVRLVSITAYRGYKYLKGQDADFINLDLTVRPDDGSGFTRFRTFSQEGRLQGHLFGDRVDWLVGGYYSDERLALNDNLGTGADFDRFASARVAAAIPSAATFPDYGFAGLNGFARAFATARAAVLPAADRQAVVDAISAQVNDVTVNGATSLDRFRQRDRTAALFTHDIVRLSSRLSLTLGGRYTWDNKRLDADLRTTGGCTGYVADVARLRALAANGGAAAVIAEQLANGVLAPFTGLVCAVNGVNGQGRTGKHEGEWTGTAALAWHPAAHLLAYGSVSRGYKAGGFNLDRGALFNPSSLATLPLDALAFAPETVEAAEVGLKYERRALTVSASLFRQLFRGFQLNAYNGLNFVVSNVAGCKDSLGGRDADAIAGNSACARERSGVVSQGVELEASVRPLRDVALTGGMAYADTRYRHDLAGSPDASSGDTSLPLPLFRLPGRRLSNAPPIVLTGSAAWTPPLGERLQATLYADARYTGGYNTGSDLLTEKKQDGFMVVNARIGVGRRDARWSLELWAQNLFDAHYAQIVFSAPLQGGGSGGLPGTVAAVRAFGTTSTQLFGAFLGEPRTWGLTARRLF